MHEGQKIVIEESFCKQIRAMIITEMIKIVIINFRGMSWHKLRRFINSRKDTLDSMFTHLHSWNKFICSSFFLVSRSRDYLFHWMRKLQMCSNTRKREKSIMEFTCRAKNAIIHGFLCVAHRHFFLWHYVFFSFCSLNKSAHKNCDFEWTHTDTATARASYRQRRKFDSQMMLWWRIPNRFRVLSFLCFVREKNVTYAHIFRIPRISFQWAIAYRIIASSIATKRRK